MTDAMSVERGVCVVAPGGGIRTAYNAGVMRAIHECWGLGSVDRVVALSGSALNWTYAASGQVECFEPFWIELIASKKFIRPFRHPTGRGVMDIDFLVDEMVKRRYPLDLEALKRSPMRMDVGVTHAVTAQATWFGVHDGLDFREVIRATCAPPYVFGKHVQLNGQPYCDGGVASPTGIERVSGENRVLVVLTQPGTQPGLPIPVREALRWLLIRDQAPALQEAILTLPERRAAELHKLEHLHRCGRVAIIRPSRALPSLAIDPRVSCVKATIAQGYRDVMEHTGLELLFGPDRR